jgi:hypothetical protein
MRRRSTSLIHNDVGYGRGRSRDADDASRRLFADRINVREPSALIRTHHGRSPGS